jgi:hypothetical protein
MTTVGSRIVARLSECEFQSLSYGPSDTFGGIDLNKLAAQMGALPGAISNAGNAVQQAGGTAKDFSRTVKDMDRQTLALQRPVGQISSVLDWLQAHETVLVVGAIVIGSVVVLSLVTSAAMLVKTASIAAAAA